MKKYFFIFVGFLVFFLILANKLFLKGVFGAKYSEFIYNKVYQVIRDNYFTIEATLLALTLLPIIIKERKWIKVILILIGVLNIIFFKSTRFNSW